MRRPQMHAALFGLPETLVEESDLGVHLLC